jgi:hypothetical protein
LLLHTEILESKLLEWNACTCFVVCFRFWKHFVELINLSWKFTGRSLQGIQRNGNTVRDSDGCHSKGVSLPPSLLCARQSLGLGTVAACHRHLMIYKPLSLSNVPLLPGQQFWQPFVTITVFCFDHVCTIQSGLGNFFYSRSNHPLWFLLCLKKVVTWLDQARV